ncbi:hypothetical protein GCM10007063_34280 [Lentibacillus kapialis]|uniref:Uncharacterized protein n=1 Tax=Lentibacillus kapialis TaxID=340214 RepID=A0A917V1D5_9BACI|nr:hypothetical protein GCM10007063_34280 [Lentibacillus kapialis]
MLFMILILLHLSFASEYAINKQEGMLRVFLITQGTLIMVVAILFAAFYLIVSFAI